jgi:hypothetical protein
MIEQPNGWMRPFIRKSGFQPDDTISLPMRLGAGYTMKRTSMGGQLRRDMKLQSPSWFGHEPCVIGCIVNRPKCLVNGEFINVEK